jgi:hypothetical protein
MGDETKKLYERSIAICIRYEEPNAVNTAIELISIGTFHRTRGGREEFLAAKPCLEKAIQNDSMNRAPKITEAHRARFLLASILTELQ